MRELSTWRRLPEVRTISDYHDHPAYIDALAKSIERHFAELDWEPERVIASYHGIPKSYFEKGDPYHCHCHKTSRLLRERLGWSDDYLLTTFQSRFGPEEWLQPYTDETLEKLKQMIQRSSNTAASEMLDRVGIDYLADLLQSPRYRLYDPEKGGGIWVGKEYGKAPARRRDPLHNLSHGATALQVARFYYLLETGQLVSPQLSELMKAILAETEIEHKFVKGIRSVKPDSEIYRKSGTWGPYHSDSAIIEHDGRRYIAVALAKSRHGEQWLQKLIVALDEVVCQTETNQN